LKCSYSGLNLLQERIFGLSHSKGFFKYLLTNRKYITITLPYYEYLRGIVFIEDLRDVYGEEVPFSLDISKLLYILYDDFLNQIKRGAKNEEIAHYLIGGKERYFSKQQKRVLKAITKHVFEMDTIEEGEEAHSNEKTAYLDIRIRETEVLRGEILLNDLESFLQGRELSVEQVIAIVYLEFIERIKQEGNSTKIQKSVLGYLKR
jgi:hypothetical protein